MPEATRLPPLELSGTAGTVALRAPELGSTVLLLVRDEALERARAYITTIEQHAAEISDWYARVLLVTEHEQAHTMLPNARAAPEAWYELAMPPEDSALIIADRWGEIYFAQHTRTFTDLPTAKEIEEWTRFLATQCPECGVIDEPGHGEWSP